MNWRRAAVAVAAGLIGLGSAAVYTIFVSDFEIINASGPGVEALSVVDGPRTWALGHLNPGERRRFRHRLVGEGALKITWVIGNRQYADTIGDYYTEGVPVRDCTGVITSSGFKDSCLRE